MYMYFCNKYRNFFFFSEITMKYLNIVNIYIANFFLQITALFLLLWYQSEKNR